MTIPASAMKEVSERAAMPVMPWPMVQPSAMIPPAPIRAEPARCRRISRASSKASQCTSPLRQAARNAPAGTPNTPPMRKEAEEPEAVISHSSACPIGRTKL